MLHVRNIRSDDHVAAARVESFLAANPDPGVRARPSDLLEAALRVGQGLTVDDGVDIVACSLIYKFLVSPPTAVYSEIGTMRITANGLGLQQFLAQFHLIQLHFEEDIAPIPGTFAVVSPSSASEHNLHDTVGMIPWQPPLQLTTVRDDSGVPFRNDKLILAAAGKTIQAAFASLKALHIHDRLFATPKGGQTAMIHMGWFEPMLLALGP